MSKLEWKLFLISNACIPTGYFAIPYFWTKMNEAQTSFMSELYWLPILITGLGSIFALLLDYTIIESFFKKDKK